MPWLRSQLGQPGWTTYANAVASTPLCCPSRASMLTGRGAWRTGVRDNTTGWALDDADTLPVWLHAAGYRTAMIGKYLNGYPWDRGPFVPPGWDRWLAKTNASLATTYEGYVVVDQGVPREVGTAPQDYATDLLGAAALSFVRAAPPDRPWFLYVAPPAGHEPWTPAPRHAGVYAGVPIQTPTGDVVNDVAGKPAWLRAQPTIDADRRDALAGERVAQRESLLAADDLLRDLVALVAARGEADDTVIVVTSDNGYAFGEHRWVGKQVPYEPSLRIPLAIYAPGSVGGLDDDLASNLDIAPTIASIAGATPTLAFDGRDLLGGLPPASIPIAWSGDGDVPPWMGVRTADHVYIRWWSGEEELYDLRSDPDQLRNLAEDPVAVAPFRELLSGAFGGHG
jgi:arylsulfatase A-like enzyme